MPLTVYQGLKLTVAKGDQLCSRATKSLYLVAHLAIRSSRMSHSSFIDNTSTGAIH